MTQSFEERFDELFVETRHNSLDYYEYIAEEITPDNIKYFIRLEIELAKKEERDRIIGIMGENWRNTIEQNPRAL